MKRYDDYVVVIPLNGKKILVQHQYKPGVKKFCWGFPAGFISGKESPLAAAKRELFEETGLIVSDIQKLGKYYDNVSKGSEGFTVFLARSTKPGRVNQINPDAEESKIKNVWVSKDKLRKISMPGACMSLAKELLLNRY